MAMPIQWPGHVVDLRPYLDHPKSQKAQTECRKAARAFETDGFVVFHDPEVDFVLCREFMKMMERFALLPDRERRKTERRDYYHQTGFTPQDAETPGALYDDQRDPLIDLIPEGERPHPVTGPDRKMRYMFNIGLRPTEPTGKYPMLDGAPQIVPDGFPEWLDVALPWGEQLRDAGVTLLEMAAIGWDCEDLHVLSSVVEYGYNLLAPTMSDLTEDGVGPDTVFAGVHKDSSMLTVHPRATHAGLDVWTRDLRKVAPRVPAGCLLAQGGRILEWLTGGRAYRGLHQVVNRPEHMPKIELARREKRRLIRVASPEFLRPPTDYVVKPIGEFATPDALARYEPFVSGTRLMEGLARRGLAAD